MAAISSSPTATEIIFCLNRTKNLNFSRQTAFDALLLLEDYVGASGTGNLITPASKKRVQRPLEVLCAAALFAAVQQQPLSSDDNKDSLTAIHAAATSLFSSSSSSTFTAEALEQSAKIILADREETTTGSTTTSQLLEQLYTKTAQENVNLVQFINLKTCFDLLEVLCLSPNSNSSSAVLRRGGALVAAACLAAAFCITSPKQLYDHASTHHHSHTEGGSALLCTLSTLTGFPTDVLFAQVQTVLTAALDF